MTLPSGGNAFSSLSQFTPPGDDTPVMKPRKKRSFMCSLRHLTLSRRKHPRQSDSQNEQSLLSQFPNTAPTSIVSQSLSTGKRDHRLSCNSNELACHSLSVILRTQSWYVHLCLLGDNEGHLLSRLHRVRRSAKQKNQQFRPIDFTLIQELVPVEFQQENDHDAEYESHESLSFPHDRSLDV